MQIVRHQRESEVTELEVLEMKYCERCGRLSLRSCGSLAVYCRSCVEAIASLPEPTTVVSSHGHGPKVGQPSKLEFEDDGDTRNSNRSPSLG